MREDNGIAGEAPVVIGDKSNRTREERASRRKHAPFDACPARGILAAEGPPDHKCGDGQEKYAALERAADRQNARSEPEKNRVACRFPLPNSRPRTQNERSPGRCNGSSPIAVHPV